MPGLGASPAAARRRGRISAALRAGSTTRYTATIAVVAADALREQRLAGRDQISLDEREALQLPQAEKERLATHVVVNDGSVEQLREQLSGVLAKLSS